MAFSNNIKSFLYCNQFQGNIRKTWKELKSDDDFGDMTLASEDK